MEEISSLSRAPPEEHWRNTQVILTALKFFLPINHNELSVQTVMGRDVKMARENRLGWWISKVRDFNERFTVVLQLKTFEIVEK